MPRKSKSLHGIEKLIEQNRQVSTDMKAHIRELEGQLQVVHTSIAELEVLAADLQPKPRKAKNPLGVKRIENQP